MKLLAALFSLVLVLGCMSVAYRIGHREGVRQGHREYQVFIDAVQHGQHANIGEMDCVAVDQLPPGHRP